MDQWLFPFYHSAGSLNYGSINDTALDDLLVSQRADDGPGCPEGVGEPDLYARTRPGLPGVVAGPLRAGGWHNYVMNYRYHGECGFLGTATQATRHAPCGGWTEAQMRNRPLRADTPGNALRVSWTAWGPAVRHRRASLMSGCGVSAL